MILGIDASNIRAGGGLTHLRELLSVARPSAHGIDRVHVWAGTDTLSALPKHPWLVANRDPLLDGSLAGRLAWQRFKSGRVMREAQCAIAFVPGGAYLGKFRPFVAMSQNLLPFQLAESRRFARRSARLRYAVLRRLHSATFREAAGVIFLTEAARVAVQSVTGPLRGRTIVISHGIAPRFFSPPRNRAAISPFRWLYVSTIAPYKHQVSVVKAVSGLRAAGFDLSLDLVGAAYGDELARLRQQIKSADPSGAYILYHGPEDYEHLAARYRHADGFVFASTCESMPCILVESMASGLPIACSDRSVMREVLGSGGVYFDAEDPPDIARAMARLMQDSSERMACAAEAFARAREFSWERCAEETLAFLTSVPR